MNVNFEKMTIMSDKCKIKIFGHIIPSLLSIVMLMLCVEQWPYFYYILLRFVICCSAIFVALFAYFRGEQHMYNLNSKFFAYINWSFTGIFGFIALLFNPILPVHLSRDIWLPIDFFVAGLFFIGLFAVRYKPD